MYKPLQGNSIPMQPVTGHDASADAHCDGWADATPLFVLRGTAVMAGLAA